MAPVEAAGIPAEALKNATYSGIYEEPVALTNGRYEGKPFVEGDSSRPVVEYIDGVELAGDLDGDGVDDAVVFLLERGGGTGAFTYVAAQLNRDGQPVDAGAVRIEDRIGVKSAAVADGQIALEIITQGPGDTACCGTHKAHKAYALRDGRLAEVTPAGGGLVKVSAADLDGTSWTLKELKEGQPAAAEAEVILSFQDGQVRGSGGCNDYTGSFSLGETNPFTVTVGPLAATRQACPEPAGSQETAYFTALQAVTEWGYRYGDLALYYADDQGAQARLLFAPACVPAGCGTQAGDYVAASSISRNGFAKDADAMRKLDGQEIMVWGFVDASNIYGDAGAKAILGDWWSGDGPDATTWRFNLKAEAGDKAGNSFAVLAPNGPGRDELLKAFVAGATAQTPTRVFVTGKVHTFDAPTNGVQLTGLWVEARSSDDIRLEPPAEKR
jgi:heat shock protein HslJ